MTRNNQPRTVHYWADNHLIVTGNQYQLIDNQSQQLLYSTIVLNDAIALERCGEFLRAAWEVSRA